MVGCPSSVTTEGEQIMKHHESRRQWIAASASAAALALVPALARGGGRGSPATQGALPSGRASQRALSAEESATLTWMREEEKLARDTYITLGAKFPHRTFTQIAASEQQHMDSVLRFLEKYGIPDPALPGVGAFANPALQALYDALVARGSASLVDALGVGGFIEETDMVDLQAAIAGTTHADIATMYANLLAGSVNHLQAFVAALAALGVRYVPQVLDQAAFDEIVAS